MRDGNNNVYYPDVKEQVMGLIRRGDLKMKSRSAIRAEKLGRRVAFLASVVLYVGLFFSFSGIDHSFNSRPENGREANVVISGRVLRLSRHGNEVLLLEENGNVTRLKLSGATKLTGDGPIVRGRAVSAAGKRGARHNVFMAEQIIYLD